MDGVMSGQAGGRGYLVQAFICVLDAVEQKWDTLTLEPDEPGDKVDIRWTRPSWRGVVQVKSSQNTIALADAKRWAEELKSSVDADEYELQLIGPVSGGVSELSSHDGVALPTPQPLNLAALLAQAAHKLDHYLRRLNLGQLSPVARELLAKGLITKLSMYGTSGRTIRREEFDQLLLSWIDELRTTLPSAFVPHQLPPPPADFTGRRIQLDAVKTELDSTKTSVAGINGMGGIGKTSFTLKLASELVDAYPDGQVHLELFGLSKPLSADEVAARVIRSFAPEANVPAAMHERLALYRNVLHQRRVLIVLENAADAEQLAPLVPGPGSLLLFTSRMKFTLPGMVSLDLPLLDPEESIALVLAIAPRVGGAAAELVHWCGRLPLALRVSSSTLRERVDVDVGEYVRRLASTERRLGLAEGAIETSVQLLPVETRGLFNRLTPFPKDFDLPAIAAVWDLDEDTASEHVGRLLRFSLLQWDDEARRYSLHDLVRLYAAKHATNEESGIAGTRFSEYYLSLSRAIADRYEQGGEHVYEALEAFDAERHNIIGGFLIAASNAETDSDAARTCSDYVYATARVRELRQSPLERLAWSQEGAAAALKLRDINAMVGHTGNMGRAFRELRMFDQALESQERILGLARDQGFVPDQARALLQIGMIHGDQKHYALALASMNEALSLARQVNDVELELYALNNIAAAHIAGDEPSLAKAPLERALELAPTVNDPRALLTTLHNLGTLVTKSTEPMLAIEMLEKALELGRDLGNTGHVFHTLRMLANAYRAVGRVDDAIEKWNECLRYARAVGDVATEVSILTDLGEIAIAKEEEAEARSMFVLARETAHAAGDAVSEAFALSHLADLEQSQGNSDAAIKALEVCLEVLVQHEKPEPLARAKLRLGFLLEDLGQFGRADQLIDEGLIALLELGHPRAAELKQRVRERRTDRPSAESSGP